MEERGQQVTIMGDIFLKARRVLSWLGQDAKGQSSKAFGAVCKIVSSWRPESNLSKFQSYVNAFEPNDAQTPALDETEWLALRAMFKAPYFTRFWVIQELTLAKSGIVIWGEHHISWGLIGLAAAWLLTRGWTRPIGGPVTAAFNAFLMYVLPLAKYSALATFSKLDLSVVLGVTMDRFQSTDPRDRIYALLGMPFAGSVQDQDCNQSKRSFADQLDGPEGIALIKPAYNDHVRFVYVDAARHMLRQDAHLRLLSAVQHGAELDLSWPSWVPRWDQKLPAEPLALCGEHGFYANAGELFFPNDDTFGKDGESLLLKGLQCESITDVSEMFVRGCVDIASLTDKNRKAFEAVLAELNDQSKQFRASWSATLEKMQVPGCEDLEMQADLVAQGIQMSAVTSLPGKYTLRESSEMIRGERAQLDSLGDFLLYWRERSMWQADELQAEKLGDFWKRIEKRDPYDLERALSSVNVVYGRRIFHCADGTFGLGPAAMKPDDVVVILFGAIVPYVLRPLRPGQWRLIGECFVPSLMQGEAVEAAGLLRPGTFWREDGELKLDPNAHKDSNDPRFSRRIGDCHVMRFEIR